MSVDFGPCATDFDPELAEEIKSFCDQRLFFWLEIVCLINALSGAVLTLPIIAKWLKGHTRYEDASLAGTKESLQNFMRPENFWRQAVSKLAVLMEEHIAEFADSDAPANGKARNTAYGRDNKGAIAVMGYYVDWVDKINGKIIEVCDSSLSHHPP
ncbi:hypothetical protein BDR07DRAFT_1483291 [Suillus spraguei]|nr:hypothetical protein BDR07DRAFT_1483291 [Suillus spraguei]